MIEVLGAHGMRMQLETREVGHPGERCGSAGHHFVGAAARRKPQRHHLHPGRPRVRRTLLIERWRANAIGEPHQHVRPPAGAAQRAFRYRQVVIDKIELGVLRLGEQHFAGIRDRDPVPADIPRCRFAS